MKRGKPLKRTGFKRKNTQKKKQAKRKAKKGSNRDNHKGERDEYLRANPRCEFSGCLRLANEVDHIVQVSGSTFECVPNYFATCRPCHDSKHRENRRGEQIRIKSAKGEWLTDQEQLTIFGRTYGCGRTYG